MTTTKRTTGIEPATLSLGSYQEPLQPLASVRRKPGLSRDFRPFPRSGGPTAHRPLQTLPVAPGVAPDDFEIIQKQND